MSHGWHISKLGALCKFQAGQAFPRREQGHKNGDYPFIKVSDMMLPSNGHRIYEANNWISQENAKKLRAKLIPIGSSVFAKIGEGLKAERIREIVRPTVIDNNMMAAVPIETSVNFRFIRYLLESINLASLAEGSALPFLRQKTLQDVEVKIPPLMEQMAIAATLGALDDKIESNRSLLARTEELIFALFARFFDVSPRESGIPVSELVGVNPARYLPRESKALKIPMSNILENTGSVFEWEYVPFTSGSRFINGDVLFARITPCLENGKTAFVDMLQPGEVGFGSTEFIVMSPRGSITTAWIYAFARNNFFRQWAMTNMTGSTGRQRFQAPYLDEYLIEPPSEDSLRDFNCRAMPSVLLMTQKRNEINKLISVRDTLLPELMSGRIRVPEARGVVQQVTDTELPRVEND